MPKTGAVTAAELALVHQDLIDAGVMVMNNSWNADWAGGDVSSFVDAYQPFVDNGGIVVFATGDDSAQQPSAMASLPSQGASAAILERGWLAAAAVDSNNPDTLAEYSNACGIAMDYCLVAPGDVIVTGPEDGPADPTYQEANGTSFAAPQVSAAAALVWEAFPYFDNDLVRQTLLGTATDLGEPGVDPVFGHGLLNIAAAVKGPARLDWGDILVDFDSVRGSAVSRWYNDISGEGGITKQGEGTLMLFGDNSYRGGTVIWEGGIQVFDHTLPGNVYVAPTAYFGLVAASVEGDLLIDGGLLTYGGGAEGFEHVVGGDLTFGSSFWSWGLEIGSRLQVNGVAKLNGYVEVLGISPGYVHRSSELILYADGGISGAFTGVTASPGVFLDASLGYGANTVWLDIRRLDVEAAARSMGLSAAASTSAQRVEHAFDAIDSGEFASDDNAEFVDAAASLQRTPTAAAAESALGSLSGELHARADATTFDAVDMNRRALSMRFDELLQQPIGNGGWSQHFGGNGRGSYGATDFDINGWMLGSDMRLGAHGVIGFSFSQSHASGHLDDRADRSRDRQTQAQFYLGALNGNAYAIGQAGFGRFDRDLRRTLLLGQDHHGVVTDYSGRLLSASAETGYRFDLGATALTPYLGADFIQLDREGFREDGASGFGLRTHASRAERGQAIAGLRVTRQWQGFALRGYAEWQQSLHAQGLEINASFVGIDAWSPLSSGMQPARSGGLLGVSFDSRVSDNALLSLGFDRNVGEGGGGDDNLVAATLRMGF